MITFLRIITGHLFTVVQLRKRNKAGITGPVVHSFFYSARRVQIEWTCISNDFSRIEKLWYCVREVPQRRYLVAIHDLRSGIICRCDDYACARCRITRTPNPAANASRLVLPANSFVANTCLLLRASYQVLYMAVTNQVNYFHVWYQRGFIEFAVFKWGLHKNISRKLRTVNKLFGLWKHTLVPISRSQNC